MRRLSKLCQIVRLGFPILGWSRVFDVFQSTSVGIGPSSHAPYDALVPPIGMIAYVRISANLRKGLPGPARESTQECPGDMTVSQIRAKRDVCWYSPQIHKYINQTNECLCIRNCCCLTDSELHSGCARAESSLRSKSCTKFY